MPRDIVHTDIPYNERVTAFKMGALDKHHNPTELPSEAVGIVNVQKMVASVQGVNTLAARLYSRTGEQFHAILCPSCNSACPAYFNACNSCGWRQSNRNIGQSTEFFRLATTMFRDIQNHNTWVMGQSAPGAYAAPAAGQTDANYEIDRLVPSGSELEVQPLRLARWSSSPLSVRGGNTRTPLLSLHLLSSVVRWRSAGCQVPSPSSTATT